MKRSATGTGVVLALVLGSLALVAVLAASPRGGAGSVVIVTIDTLRWDRPGFDGGTGGLTPNLDRLAAEGAVFEDASCAAPITLASHATILTGLWPPRHGLRDNDSPRPLPPADQRDFLTGAEILKGAGYATAAFVSGSPLAPRWGLDAGFETYDAPPEEEPGGLQLGERTGAETVDRALGWLRSRNRKRPFLLWVHLFDPHHPYAAPGGAGLPTDSPAAYDEEVKYADAQAGRLLDELRAQGVLARGVVAVCADHGEGLGVHGETTHGYFLHRSTIRVPFLLRAPEVPAGTRVKEPVSLADLLPTVLDAAGRPLPGSLLDGRSRMPRFRTGGTDPGPSPQYAETVYGWRTHRWAQAVSLRSGSLRVIDFGGDRREVYDLAADPGEEKDLGPGAPKEAAEAGAAAWALFGSPPRIRGAASNGAPDPSLLGIPYISSYSPVRVGSAAENGGLPLPSASFLQRFETALRMLDRARREGDSRQATLETDHAIDLLKTLGSEEPGNPAPPFWIGRGLRQKAKQAETPSPLPWLEAFLRFQEAGRLGYEEPRTVSLMLEALFQAKNYGEMLKVARLSVDEQKMDGDCDFWVWVALAWWMGERNTPEIPSTQGRARALEALAKAEARARSEKERRHLEEIRAIFR